MHSLRTLALTAALFAGATGAQAALVTRSGGMIYDTTMNITWMTDMNYAKSSGYTGTGVNSNGRMTWNAAKIWADNLVFGGFDDWRVATVDPTDCPTSGHNCTAGELSHLFTADLGNQANISVLNPIGKTPTQIANLALFSNVQSNGYWSGVEYAPDASQAWYFGSNDSFQTWGDKTAQLYALAVRSGDVAGSVPEPQTLALTMLALGAALVARRKRLG